MMGRLKSDQGQLFYEFCLGDAVPEDHLVRKIDAALDLTWLRSELASHYSSMGRPSIDPELMIRMLVVGYVFAIRSERLICREVQVNLAYRWFCKLGIEEATVPPPRPCWPQPSLRAITAGAQEVQDPIRTLEHILRLGDLTARRVRRV